MTSGAFTPLGGGVEFNIIRQMLDRWGDFAVGIGDDAAVLAMTRGESLVVSVDTAVEGRHFERGWLRPDEIGYRAVTAALSDLAAMAARPTGVLIALILPDDWRSAVDALADGIGAAVRAAGPGTLIRGGNVSGGSALSITTTVIGEVFAPLRRDEVRAGDTVYVTGRLGGPGAALAALKRGAVLEADGAGGAHRERFARPEARVAEARWLADHGATAAIDISDGLVADLEHLAAASRVSIELDARKVPCLAGVTVEDAMVSGEEYELIVAMRGTLPVEEFERRFGLPLTAIGRATAPGGPDEHCVVVQGARVAGGRGHDHFSG
jgi:thiamine-monophosphate kinase